MGQMGSDPLVYNPEGILCLLDFIPQVRGITHIEGAIVEYSTDAQFEQTPDMKTEHYRIVIIRHIYAKCVTIECSTDV